MQNSKLINIFNVLPTNFPRTFFYITYVLSLISAVVFGINVSNQAYPIQFRTEFLNQLTFYFDPFLIQLISLIIYIVLIWFHTKKKDENVLSKIVLCIVLPIAIIVFSYFLEQTVFKPAFKYARPSIFWSPLDNPWLTTFIVGIIKDVGSNFSAFQDVPSGFALRQFIIFYFYSWLLLQKDYLSNKKVLKSVFWMLNILFLFFVCFSRVYRANHTVFAISMAFIVGTFLFWSIIGILYSLIPDNEWKMGENYSGLVSELFAIIISFIFIFIIFSNDADKWKGYLYFFIVLLSIIHLIPKKKYNMR